MRTAIRPRPNAAGFFASELVDQEMREQRSGEEDQGHWHNARYTIDVRHPDESVWQRFRVTCKCKLEFSSVRVTP
jgi:hypothetical protein